ncbi:hypothetical protein GTP46_18695 [Duganella sp. FT135W]|uniref:Uncharacterized protein n=1 Tax=Duganella flavida TaxID=2692175 RepID=A0A6L8KB30_9BURK|nr:hypothetical protein [Duganella flavida]MYM24669.1 hypothetical protein [Duganella flavida]
MDDIALKDRMKMRLKNFIAGGVGSGFGTIIWECYNKSWAEVDWLKVSFITLFTILIAALFSISPTNQKQDE